MLRKAFIFVLMLLVMHVSAAQNTALINSTYPRCDYKVIDIVEVKTRVNVEANSLNPLQHQKAFQKITRKLSELAIKANADVIVLIGKRQSKTNLQNYLFYSAELIKDCVVDASVAVKTAKFNNEGRAQLVLPTSTFEIENTLVIKMPALAKRRQPALLNKIVSIKEGAYKLMLNDSLAQVIDVLGTPTVEMQVSELSQVLVYGRQHLFEFTDEKLSAVNSYNAHFTSDLKNLTEFDDRLDDVSWQVEGKYTKQKRLTAKQAERIKNNEIVFQNKTETLRVLTQRGSNSVGSVSTYVVNNFRLARTQDTFYNGLTPPNSLSILTFISTQLHQEVPSFLISDIPYTPTMTAWITPVKRLYTFGQHVAIEAIGDRVSTIYFFENLYNEESPLYEAGLWHIGQYKQGMSAEAAQSLAGDNGQYFNEELEVIQNGVIKRLYFYEQKKQVKLYGGEISFY
jgi:hypothetical protein